MTTKTKSAATQRITSKMRLDWMASAQTYAVKLLSKGAYRNDRHRMRATYELRDCVGLILELMDDPTVRGSVDLGREYVERRSARLVKQYGK